MTIRDIDFQILTTSTPNNKSIPNNNPTHSCNNTVGGGKDETGLQVGRDEYPNTTVMHINQQIKSPMLTLLDSGASDHCFADRNLFSSYTLLNKPVIGLGAGQDSTFQIVGTGSVIFESITDGKTRKITLDKALHTPNLRSNLISISKLGEKGASISFSEKSTVITLENGAKVMMATYTGQLYAFDMAQETTSIFATQSRKTAVGFDI